MLQNENTNKKNYEEMHQKIWRKIIDLQKKNGELNA